MKAQENIMHLQQTVAKTPVALGLGGGASLYTWLETAATVMEQIGMICGGLLAFLVLMNWLYVHLKK